MAEDKAQEVESSEERPDLKRPPILFNETQAVVEKIERAIGCPLVCYWNSTDGSVCHNDVFAFYELLEQLGSCDRLAVFIKSDGGNGQASLRIVNLLRKHGVKLTALVPMECASAATMLALGADEIQMGPLAYLTAVDTSLTHALSPIDRDNDRVAVSLDELLRVVKLWEESAKDDAEDNPYSSLFNHVHPLVIGAVDRRRSLSVRICTEILQYHMEDTAEIERISQHLNSAYPSHGYPIVLREAQRIGLKAGPLDPELNSLLLDLNELYSEMGQSARTDFDESNHHENEILNIIEARGTQIFYQTDQDWHYRAEERRWVRLNNESSWIRLNLVEGQVRRSRFHIR
ncbi:MAG: hypothetical protein AAGJ46_16895 [Planctomycetota bacterium]